MCPSSEKSSYYIIFFHGELTMAYLDASLPLYDIIFDIWISGNNVFSLVLFVSIPEVHYLFYIPDGVW